MNVKNFVFLLAVAIVLPVATALDCSSLSGAELEFCREILSSDLTQNEKEILISDIINPSKQTPDHDFVYSWNLGLNIINSPDGTVKNSGAIRNAWLKILTPMPSVLENETLYIPTRAKLLSEYNYGITLPSGKYKYDCKTKYALISQNEKLDIYADDRLIGHDKLTSFGITQSDNSKVKIRAELEIYVRYEIKYYRYHHGYCRHVDSDYVNNMVKLTDQINATVYDKDLGSSVKIIDKYNDVTSGILEAKDYSFLELSFENSIYQRANYDYNLEYGSSNILRIRATKVNVSKIENIFVEDSKNKIEFFVKDTTNCEIKSANHFESQTTSCNLEYNGGDFNIKTDKINYDENETIVVNITPNNLLLNVTYANQTIQAKDSIDFIAIKNQNEILAQLNNVRIKQIINVRNPENKTLLKELSSISFFGFILYSLIKKYYFLR